MTKKVYVDQDGKQVPEGSVESAWQFNEGDVRLEKFRTAVKARKAVAAGKPIPGSDAARAAGETEEETVERVERKR
jgi:hypothetical protein